ncbi:MAG: hypothetical protein H6729_05040 [Deltaproteobacteria bacterium]|nr:hypothetical protein [Deltaproteobacteria bacterium]
MWPDDGLYLISVGGGGGAAQLMPSTLLRSCVEAAHDAVFASDSNLENNALLPTNSHSVPSEQLTNLFENLNHRMGALVSSEPPGSGRWGDYVGSGAYVVACAVELGTEEEEENQTFWFDSVGLGRAYAVEPGAWVQLTMDDSLDPLPTSGVDVQSSHEPRRRSSAYSRIVTSSLNGQWLSDRQSRGRAPIAYRANDVLGFLLATETIHQAVPPPLLAEETRFALENSNLDEGARILWTHLRERLATDESRQTLRADYDRTAALLLLKPRLPYPARRSPSPASQAR